MTTTTRHACQAEVPFRDFDGSAQTMPCGWDATRRLKIRDHSVASYIEASYADLAEEGETAWDAYRRHILHDAAVCRECYGDGSIVFDEAFYASSGRCGGVGQCGRCGGSGQDPEPGEDPGEDPGREHWGDAEFYFCEKHGDFEEDGYGSEELLETEILVKVEWLVRFSRDRGGRLRYEVVTSERVPQVISVEYNLNAAAQAALEHNLNLEGLSLVDH